MTAVPGRVGRDTGAADGTWWRDAVVYQVYPRSFADGDGDGIGDLVGLVDRLPHLAALGVDAIWINPWYPSPMEDAGYDIADFRDVDPVFGTLDDARRLLGEAHRLGLRVLLDIVPNHTSHRHPWFQEALAASPGAPERDRYVFRDGRGTTGELPPNDWISEFGGPAWTRTVDADGSPGQWYLRLYAAGQPDLDWSHPDVRADFERTLRFWFDLGVDGFRIDSAHALVKDDDLADVGELTWPLPPAAADDVVHPHWDRPGVHDVYRSWRSIADEYDPPRVFVAEAWIGDPGRLSRYLRRDELHTAFNFQYLITPWRAEHLRATIDDTLATHDVVGAPPTWVLSNHDVPRVVSRYARHQPEVVERLTLDDLLPLPGDVDIGTRRARAAALLMLALPGSAYVYQGEELGLPEVEDLPADRLQDPVVTQTDGRSRGRDGCRVPLPWSGDEPPFGFGPPGTTPWLPQPAGWGDLTVEAQVEQPGSMLELYRSAIALRRDHPALGDGTLRWLTSAAGTLCFAREPGFWCLVNLAAEPVHVPPSARILLASGPLADHGYLPSDTAVWLSTESN